MLTPNIQPMLPLLAVEDLELIPLQKADAKDRHGKCAGKRPLHNDWRNDKPLTKSSLRKYVDQGHNIGARLGRSILVVDIDPRNFAEPGETDREGKELSTRPDQKLQDDFDIGFLDYPNVLTGSWFPDNPVEIQTGYHVYMRIPDGVIADNQKLRRTLSGFRGIDFKWAGGQVLIPGCVHPETGRSYEWDEMSSDILDGIPPAPQKLVDALLTTRPQHHHTTGGKLYSCEQLQGALDTLDVTDFRDHELWLEFMIACHAATGGEGATEFTAWSTSDPVYADRAADILYRWDTFNPDLPGGISHLSFRKIVDDHGGTVPMDASDYDDVDPEEDRQLVAATRGGMLLPAQMNKAGDKIKDTQSNALLILRDIAKREDWRIRFNSLFRRVEILGDVPWNRREYPFVGEELLNDRLWLFVNGYFPNYKYATGISTHNIAFALNVLAQADKFNPIVEYLEDLEWDGQPRIDRWLTDRLGGPDTKLTRKTSSLLFRAMVARAYCPGAKFDSLIVLEGKQGTGKSSALAALCPNHEWFTDHPFELAGRGNPADAVMPFLGKWLHEFPEISTLTAATMNKAKAMLSKPVDHFRRPYGRGFEEAPRGFVSIGTTNDSVYLADMTGNRRFLPVALDDRYIDVEKIQAERNDLFAEAVVMYKEDPDAALHLPSGLWESAAEAVADRQADHPWMVLLEDHLADRTRVAAKELYDLVKITGTRGSQDTKVLAAVMRALGWTYKKSIRIPAEEFNMDWHSERLGLKPAKTYRGYSLDIAS